MEEKPKKRLKASLKSIYDVDYSGINSLASAFVSRIPQFASNCYITFNMETRRLVNTSNSVEDFFGIGAMEIFNNPLKILEVIYPDQRRELLHYINQTELSLYSQAHVKSIVFNIRFQMKKPTLRHVLLQVYPLLSDEKPKFILGLFSDINSYTSASFQSPLLQYFILDKEKNRLLHFEESELLNEKTKSNLTKTEEVVMNHINTGLKNLEIAKVMSVSVETIRTHRRNIRRKKKIQIR